MELSQLSGFSHGELLRACTVLNLRPQSGRKDHLLSALVLSGFSITKIDAAAKAPVTPAVASGSFDAAIDAAVRDAEVRLSNRLNALEGGLSDVNQQVIDIRDTPADVSSAVRDAVRDAVAAAFAPVQAAFDAAPADVQAQVKAAIPRQRKPISDVFDVPMKGDCEVWGVAGDFDPDYVWDEQNLSLALLALETGDNVWLHGERGTGKTEFARNLAARLGRPFFRVSFDSTMERQEFIGADGLVDGNTVWQDGQVLDAFRTDGAICLLDEISTIRPEFATVLHALLEQKAVYTVTSTGEVVRRGNGMAFIAADNTNGCGDESGRYSGTRAQNSALVDRFAFSLKVLFMDQQKEIDLLVKRGAAYRIAEALVRVLTACRAEVGGLLVEPPSLRAAFAFVKAERVVGPEAAWEVSVVNKSPSVSAEALRQLFSAHWA